MGGWQIFRIHGGWPLSDNDIFQEEGFRPRGLYADVTHHLAVVLLCFGGYQHSKSPYEMLGLRCHPSCSDKYKGEE